MYFHQGLKYLDIQKMIYHHFKIYNLKIDFFLKLVYGGIVVKMDNFHLFEEIFYFIFSRIRGNG
jgi:hypothetical protein